MTLSDLTLRSKIALGLALAGFVVSFTTVSTTSANGVETCAFTDYGKLVIGGLTVMVGGLGEVAALRNDGGRIANLLASGGASAVGIFHIFVGTGVIGGPC